MTRLFALLVALGACHPAPPPDARPAATPYDPVAWAPVASVDTYVLARLPAEVVYAPDGRLALAPRVPLRPVRWRVTPGQRVDRGDTLALVDSVALDGLRDEVAARRAVLDAATARADAGVGTASERAEAQGALAAVEASWEASRADLSPAAGGWAWRASAAGTVDAILCDPGEPVDAQTPCVVLVGDAAPRVQIHVPEHLLPDLDRPSGRLVVAGRTEPVALRWAGDAPALDAGSRTRTAWLLPAEGAEPEPDVLLVGRSGRVDVLVPAPPGAVRVPRSAVTRLDGTDVVFVDGAGDPHPLRILARDGDDVIAVGATVPPGTRVAVRGVLLLKARRTLGED